MTSARQRLRPLGSTGRDNIDPRRFSWNADHGLVRGGDGRRTHDVVIIGAGPAGLTAAYQLTQAGRDRHRARGRHRRRRHQPHGRARRLALRHRRPPLLHQGGGGRALWHEILPAGGLPAPAAHEPHLLQRQVLRLPARADQRAAQPRHRRGGPLRALLRLGARPPAEGHGQLRGLDRRRASAGASTACSSRPTPRRCGACRPPRSRPTGRRSASRTSRCSRPCVNADPPEAQPEGHHVPHRGVPVPEVRAGDDVGALPRHRRGAGHQGHHEHRVVTRCTTKAAARSRSPPRPTACRTRYECTDVISSMPLSGLLKAMDPPVPAPRAAAADGLSYRDFLTVALVVPEAAGSPTTGSTCTARRAARPHPELRLVVAVHGEGRAHVPRPRVLRVRGRRAVGHARRRAGRAGHARAADARPGRARAGRGRLRRADAEGVSDVRRHLQGQRRVLRAGSPRTPPTCTRSAATACTSTTTRTTRCTPPCSRSRTSSVPTTTSGRSTSRPSTTSRRRERGRRTRAPAATRRCSPAGRRRGAARTGLQSTRSISRRLPQQHDRAAREIEHRSTRDAGRRPLVVVGVELELVGRRPSLVGQHERHRVPAAPLSSTRKLSSVTRSPRGPGSPMASPLRNMPRQRTWPDTHSSSVIS